MKNISVVALLVLSSACSVVGPGEKGVRISQGEVKKETLDSGWYVYVPLVTKVKAISTRVQKTETKTEAASKDMQKVTATIAINWHVNPNTVSQLFSAVGDSDDVINQIINPAVSEVLKAATAKMTAEEILTKRIELKQHIDESLVLRLKTYNVLIDDISLVDLDFTQAFNHAVESKQIAEQKAKEAEYNVKRSAQEAKSAVNNAKGEAEANLVKARAQAEGQKLLRQSLTPEVLQYEYIKKWSGTVPTVVLGNNGSIILDPTKLLDKVTNEEIENENK